jgi:hypothetical protein
MAWFNFSLRKGGLPDKLDLIIDGKPTSVTRDEMLEGFKMADELLRRYYGRTRGKR